MRALIVAVGRGVGRDTELLARHLQLAGGARVPDAVRLESVCDAGDEARCWRPALPTTPATHRLRCFGAPRVGHDPRAWRETGLGGHRGTIERQHLGGLATGHAPAVRAIRHVRIALADSRREDDRPEVGRPHQLLPHRELRTDDRLGFGGRDRLPNRRAILRDPTEGLFEEPVGVLDPVLERRIGVGLGENAESVANTEVGGGVARLGKLGVRAPSPRISGAGDAAIVEPALPVLLLRRHGHGGEQYVAQQARRGLRVVRIEGGLVGHVEPAVGAAIGGVQVHRHVRVVPGQQRRHRTGFGCLELGAVAVQVQPLRILALTHPPYGAELTAAVGHGHAFVAIGVVDRVDQEDHRVQPRIALTLGDGSKEPEQRFFSLHLAGVDVALDIDAGLLGRFHLLRRCTGRTDDGQRHRPALVGVAVGGEVDPRRRGRHRLHECDHVVIAAGLGESARLRSRQRPRPLCDRPRGRSGRLCHDRSGLQLHASREKRSQYECHARGVPPCHGSTSPELVDVITDCCLVLSARDGPEWYAFRGGPA